MKNRREFPSTRTAGVMAVAAIITPLIAEECFGVIIMVDVPGRKLTVDDTESGAYVVVEQGRSATFRTSKGGVASMGEPDVDVVLPGVE